MRYFIFFIALCVQLQAATLKVTDVRTSGRSLELEASLRSAPTGELSFQVKDASKQNYTVSTKALPQNLWILVDTSSLCQAFKMDRYLGTLFSKLPTVLNSETLVSVVSYTQDSKTVLANQVTPNEAADIKVECQAGALSASYESALEQMLSQSDKSNLPKQVWVFSSGNILLSSSMIEEIQDNEVNLNLSLYVPMVYTEVQPALASQSKSLVDKLFYSVIKHETDGSVVLPELRIQGDFTPSINAEGATSGFKLEAYKNAKEKVLLASTPFRALVPKSWFTRLLQSLAFKVLLLLLMMYMLYKLVKSYFPKQCSDCQRTLRFEDTCCLFCHDLKNPSLVVDDTVDVSTLELKGTKATVYEQRYTLGVKGRKKKAIFQIEKRLHADKEAFAVTLLKKDKAVLLNNRPLTSTTFLANGDVLRMAPYSVTFLTGEKNEQL